MVYQATYKDKQVAAKSIEVMEENVVAAFLKEIKLMSAIHHESKCCSIVIHNVRYCGIYWCHDFNGQVKSLVDH